MRLLHAKELIFKEFVGDSIPEYAIISHRWSDDELSYQGFLRDKGQYQDGHLQGYGWTKIVKACELTQHFGLEWVWLDTICINKESSAELTEAINSMYRWYEDATYCFVFLPDVHNVRSCTCELSNKSTYVASDEFPLVTLSGDGVSSTPSSDRKTPFAFYEEEFERSCWFRRSWTLQELIAPSDPVFFNAEFEPIGTRSSLAQHIKRFTNIATDFLGPIRSFMWHACIAERMRWASGREATRIEDKAYSLLGIFGVNMPLLYGEGWRAFLRLQLEIIKRLKDETILAFPIYDSPVSWGLALNARDFAGAYLQEYSWTPRKHFEFTNMGIRFSVPINRLDVDRVVQRRKGSAGSDQFVEEGGRMVPMLDHNALFPLNCRGIYQPPFTYDVKGKVALLLRVSATEAELDIKLLKAQRWDGGICVLDDGLEGRFDHIPNDGTQDSSETYSPGGNKKWINIKTGKSASFDFVIGDTRGANVEEYSLYLDIGIMYSVS